MLTTCNTTDLRPMKFFNLVILLVTHKKVNLVITTQELQQLMEEEASVSHAGDVSAFLQSLIFIPQSVDAQQGIAHVTHEGMCMCASWYFIFV